MKLEGCAAAIAFVGQTSLFKIDCRTGLVHRFVEDGTWSRAYGKQKASGIAGDKEGELWIQDDKSVLSWNNSSKRWSINELPPTIIPK